jgi:hypothetical protein
MTTHDRVIELGAAAFDFRLTPRERDDLERHLATCSRCRGELEGMADDVRRLEARRGHRLSPSRAEAIRRSIERPASGFNPAMLLVAAALLLLATWAAATVGAQLLRQLDERLAVDLVPNPTTIPSPENAEPASAWQLTARGKVAEPIPFDPVAVVRTPTGWTAIGNRSCTGNQDLGFDCVIPIAASTTGEAWVPAGSIALGGPWLPPMSGPEIGALDAAAGPDGLVVVGFDVQGDAIGHDGVQRATTNGTAWWSSDGVTWEAQRLGDGARPATVIWSPSGWLIGGVRYGDTKPVGAIWTSVDGHSWTVVGDAAVNDIGGYVDTLEDPAAGGIHTFVVDGDLTVAGGQVCTENGLPCASAAWVSEDGLSWTRADALPTGDYVTDLVAVDDAFVAAVRVCTDGAECTTAILRSTDGRAWQTVAGPSGLNEAMAVSDGTLVLAAGEYRSLDVLVTADGLEWHPLGTVAAPDQANWSPPILVARSGDKVDLLVRIDPVDDAESEADVWTGLWEIAPVP